MKLTVIGCSPAWPNPGGAQSGYLLENPGRVLLDCGPGVLARMRQRDGGWPRVDALVITHFHLDHWGDIVPWIFGAAFGPGRGVRPPELWLPPDGSDELRRIGDQFAFGDHMDDVFRLREYEAEQPFVAAGFELTALQLPHYEFRAFGLRVSNGACVLAYSGDTAPASQLARLAVDADLFVCEATLVEPEPGDVRGHLTAEEAHAAFRASGARRLLVTHRPDELPLDAGLERAFDGLELTL